MRRLAWLVVAAACGGESAPRPEASPARDVQLYDVRAGISVCFEQTGGILDELNAQVHDGVVGEWTAKIGIRFSGFRPCSAGDADVRVRYFTCERPDGADCPEGNPSPGVRVVGRPRDGQPNIVYLRSSYRGHWMAGSCDDRLALRECTRAYATHTFGHVLGIDHAQASAGPGCDDRVVYPGGWTCPGDDDPGSVMSYCSASADRREWWKTGLVARDVTCARQFFFGDRPPPPRREACFYDCCAGDAACEARQPTPWCYPPGDLGNVGLSLNDRFARVELRGGATATAYAHEDFYGTSLTWTRDEACIPTSLRENVTSLRVR
jgi:hypothetical protein